MEDVLQGGAGVRTKLPAGVVTGFFLLVAAAILWAVGIASEFGAPGLRVYAGTLHTVPAAATHVKLDANDVLVEATRDAEGKITAAAVRLPNLAGRHTLAYTGTWGEQKTPLVLLPRYVATLCFVGTLLLIAALPFFVAPVVGESFAGQPWRFLLADPKSGFSLGQTQLLLWFVPAVCLYTTLSLPMHRFAPVTTALAVLLGMSGLTTALSAVPDKKTGNRRKLSLRNLVEDAQGRGDVSRYQFLILSLIGAATMTIAFFRALEVPAIPEQFLYLVGASQTTFVATKAVKDAKEGSLP